MKFEITRISLNNNTDTPPCEEAIRDIQPRWYTPGMTEDEYNKKYGDRKEKWKEEGSNHIILKNGTVARHDGVRYCWIIELKSLKDLIKFSEKYGEDLIVGYRDNRFNLPFIQIFDDYLD